jgi:DNA-binding transcriptional MerR regulator
MARTKNMDQDVVSAQGLADRAGESYDTVDHWAGLGLLSFKRRGKTRLFLVKENLDRCQRIRALQEDGHNLVTIKGMLASKN